MEISFIIPCYNCSTTIDETVNSILNLGLEKFEICMVDDGSKDNTYELLKKYQSKYPNVVKIGKNDKNIGGGATRNVCYKMAQYEYIFLLDSDNILSKKSFLKLLDNVKPEDNLITFDTISWFYSPEFFPFIKLLFKDLIFLKSEMVFADFRKTLIHPPVDGNYLYKREVFEEVGGYETDLGAMESWSFGHKALTQGYKYKIVRGTNYLHRVHLDSYWFREKGKNFENLRKLLLRYPSKFSAEEIQEMKSIEDIRKFLVTQENDFTVERTNFPYALLLKIYNKVVNNYLPA